MTVAIRPATREDAPAIAALFGRVRRQELPFLPTLHTPAEDRAYFTGHVMDTCKVWIAETDRLAGFVAWRDGWVDHLYVDIDHLRQGIGSALLAKAMDAQPKLQLWAFRKNAPALAFYHARGFRVVRETDGHDNEEKEPDVLMAWARDQSP